VGEKNKFSHRVMTNPRKIHMLVHKDEPTAATIVSAARRTGSSRSSNGPKRRTTHPRRARSRSSFSSDVSVKAHVKVVQMKKSVGWM
jgi:hypothetical protein